MICTNCSKVPVESPTTFEYLAPVEVYYPDGSPAGTEHRVLRKRWHTCPKCIEWMAGHGYKVVQ